MEYAKVRYGHILILGKAALEIRTVEVEAVGDKTQGGARAQDRSRSRAGFQRPCGKLGAHFGDDSLGLGEKRLTIGAARGEAFKRRGEPLEEATQRAGGILRPWRGRT
jgi:hypothetical protein